jgi:hypothetical protein
VLHPPVVALAAQLMREHPEWHQHWARADEPCAAHQRTSKLWNQIDGALPAAREVYEVLQAQGLEAHEVVHRIGTVLMEKVYAVLKQQRLYDEAKYGRKLQALVKRARPAQRRRRR